jgi:hypothetical protein
MQLSSISDPVKCSSPRAIVKPPPGPIILPGLLLCRIKYFGSNHAFLLFYI